jgi:protein TonB
VTLFAFASTGDPRGEGVKVAGGVKLDDFLWMRTEKDVALGDAAVVALLDARGRLAGVATRSPSSTAASALALPASSLEDHFATLGIVPSEESTAPSASAPPPESSSRPRVMRVSGGVLAGKAKQKPAPVYPLEAKAAHVGGSVVVEVTVGETGEVVAARAISGHPLLRDASVTAARGWTFAPTRIGGYPVKVIGTITFNYVPSKLPAAGGSGPR